MTETHPPSFRLDEFIRQRQDAFDWPSSLQVQLISQAAKIIEAISPETLLSHSPELVCGVEETARNSLGLPSTTSIVFGHSAIQLLEQILLVLRPRKLCIPGTDFFLFDLTLQKLGIPVLNTSNFAELSSTKNAKTPILFSAPNNPTGSNMPFDDLRHLLENRSGLVIIDETYHLFSRSPHERIKLLEEFPNLILLRGMSKYGLPGVSLGYALCSEAVAQMFKTSCVSSYLSALEACTLKEVFNIYDEISDLAFQLIALKKKLAERIDLATKFNCLSGDCDFLLFRSGDDQSNLVAQSLNANGYPALCYAQIPGFENVVKLFPKAFDSPREVTDIISSYSQ